LEFLRIFWNFCGLSGIFADFKTFADFTKKIKFFQILGISK